MELDDLKNTWQSEKEELTKKLRLNTSIIRQMRYEKSKTNFDRMYYTAILGKYLALVYAIISFSILFFLQSSIFEEVLIFLGGIAMIFSFYTHRKLRRPNFAFMNTVELQKSIHAFRLHIAKNAFYDKSIVLLWFLSLAPVYSRHFLHYELNPWLYVPIFILLVLASGNIYKKWDKKLAADQEQLEQLNQFTENE